MRKYLIFICTVLLASCLNNDFLERYPLGDPTAETAFETYDNFKAYAWGLYETLPSLGYLRIRQCPFRQSVRQDAFRRVG